MPYIDFESSDDYASLWYITNSTRGNVGAFRPELPLLLLLHGTYLDSSWLSNQFNDPRLIQSYNMIAIDMRVCGKSSCRPSGRHDSFVEAADIARVHQMLQLPPCHVLAFECLGVNCALRFAALFPELCLSLILCNPPPPTELKWSFMAYDEILQSWAYTEDLDSFERFGLEAVKVMLGNDAHPDLQEELVTYWERELPPNRRQRIVEQVNVILNRMPLNRKIYESIRQPVLVVHGENNTLSPIKYAEALVKDLVNSDALLYPVKGAGEGFSIIFTKTSVANQVIAKFLARLPPSRTEIRPPSVPLVSVMRRALKRLSDFMDDDSIAERDPYSSLSFCCLLPSAIADQTESLQVFGKGQLLAFNPLGPHGRPIRKVGDRKDEHWFQSGDDMISYAATSFSTKNKGSAKPDRAQSVPSTDPVTSQVAEDSRARRINAFKHHGKVVDQQVIKGSMAKVVSSNNPTAFSKRLLM